MITWGLVLETLVKWGIPLIAAAIIGLIVKHVIDPQKKNNDAGRELREQAEWDTRARKSDVLSEKCSVQVGNMQTAIDKKFAEAEAMSNKIDQDILLAVKDLQLSVKDLRDEIQDNKKDVKLLQSGVLDLHLNNLIQTCKTYIERGYITSVELMQYNERLTLYHNLGGNGHMKIWDDHIRALPLREHNE